MQAVLLPQNDYDSCRFDRETPTVSEPLAGSTCTWELIFSIGIILLKETGRRTKYEHELYSHIHKGGISLLLPHMLQSIHSRPCTEPESTARDRWPEWVVCSHGIARGWTVYMFHLSSLFCHLTLCLVSSWTL